MPRPAFWSLLVLVTAAALWLRVHDLARRPMHADEANQAVKAGDLLEHGRYHFDPADHHGPTLYFATLPVAWLRGERSLAALSETTVRLVPALAGTAVVLLIAWLVILWGEPVARTRWLALAAAALATVSPAAVYYSRDYIHETLLVAFTLATFGCAIRWRQTSRLGWAVGAGVCAGLMIATKETALLFLAAGFIAAALSRRGSGARAAAATPDNAIRPPSRPGSIAIGAVAAVLTATLLYSSFGMHPGGIRDALLAVPHGWSRATGPSGHEKPWWYYAQLFAWQRNGGLLWDQVAFSALAVGGVIVGLIRRDRLLRATALYTLVIAVALSAVPYKTPWHAIHLVPGLAVLAAGALVAIGTLRTGVIVGTVFMFFTCESLLQQTWRAAFAYGADPRNPFAYVHSSPDVLKYRALAEAALARTPSAPVRVIGSEYWPLPWYLRGLPHVGYWNSAPDDCDGALVIAAADQADAIRSRLHGDYGEAFLGLRPGYAMVLFTPKVSGVMKEGIR